MSDVLLFAETTFRNRRQKFGIKTDDRRRHMYLIGKTGMGKSVMQENMIINDIRNGNGVGVVDPHGDLAEKIIKYIPKERINDVVYFNPADMDFPIAFNVLEKVRPEVRHLVASGLLGVFKKLWADSWGPRLEYILRNAILATLDYPGATLLAVIRMLSDKPFRKDVVSYVKDPVVKSFWEKEFAGYADKFASEAVSPIQNKVGQFLSSSIIRNVVGQAKSSIDIREIMDEKKILIMNLSKGRVGEDNSTLLGAMMITKIQLAAMSRVNIPEEDRKDFFLYIDEFQNFSTDSFANILSEARKYRLSLVIAHQYIEQLSETVKPAVFGNVGTMVSFRVGATDAEELVKEFAPVFTEEDIVNLPKYEVFLKLMIDGIASEPFSAKGLPPFEVFEETGNEDKVIVTSRERYAKSKEIVEEKINKWHEESIANISSGQNQNNKKQENKGHKTKCVECGKDVYTPFEPDGIRPVYCKDCFAKKNKKNNNNNNNDNNAVKNRKTQNISEENKKEIEEVVKPKILEKKMDIDYIQYKEKNENSIKKDSNLEKKDNLIKDDANKTEVNSTDGDIKKNLTFQEKKIENTEKVKNNTRNNKNNVSNGKVNKNGEISLQDLNNKGPISFKP